MKQTLVDKAASITRKILQRRKFLYCVLVLLILQSLTILAPYYKYMEYLRLPERAKMIMDLGETHERMEKNVLAFEHWQLMNFEILFRDQICSHMRMDIETPVTWMTAITNDYYIIPAVVMGYTVQKFSCFPNMTALISEELSPLGREVLRKVGFTLQVVPRLDCYTASEKYGVTFTSTYNSPSIPGTHMRFYSWNYTRAEYKKIIYLDADVMLLHNVDELFLTPSKFAAAMCSPPESMDYCFNAGVLVIEPDPAVTSDLIEKWLGVLRTLEWCEEDQIFLFHYMTKYRGGWTSLPFVYNVRRIVHHPIKIYHFAGGTKPWRETRLKPTNFTSKPIETVSDVYDLWWKYLYEAVELYELEDWWQSQPFF